MSVLTREALESSPLADLHAIAREISLDGFRRLRKAELVDAILERQGGADEGVDDADAGVTAAETAPAAGGRDDDEDDDRPRRRRSRGGRGRRKSVDTDNDTDVDPDAGTGARDRRGAPADDAPAEERLAIGRVELLANGSGFVRVSPPDPSDDDVYISAAQVRRCELVDGDEVGGPVRAPRRSERYPSLIRIDTINGRPADEVAEGTPWDDLPATHPTERFALGDEDPTLKAIEWLTPIGRGSRVVVTGTQHAGKTETLRRLAVALAGQDGLEVSLVLAGVRPEETTHWAVEPAAALALSTGIEARGTAVERALDTARRTAARGAHAVLLVDTLDGVEPRVARRVLGAARAIPDAGSLTVIATATAPLGGETTVIALDEVLAKTGAFPAIDLLASGVVRADLLVGESGAEAIVAARAQVLEA